MDYLILVKHSLPEIDPERPAEEWRLSQEGRRRCMLLANELSVYQPSAIISSPEPKAQETAQRVAMHLDRPYEEHGGLHEHERRTVGFLPAEEFRQAVKEFFDRPDGLVFGEETASQARQRFVDAVSSIQRRYDGSSVAVVAHGTVIALSVAYFTGVDAFLLWQRLGLPSFLVLALPEYTLIESRWEVA